MVEVAIEPHAERDPAQQGSCCQPLLPGMAALKTSRTTSVAAGAAVVFGVFGGCEKGLAMTRNWKKGWDREADIIPDTSLDPGS